MLIGDQEIHSTVINIIKEMGKTITKLIIVGFLNQWSKFKRNNLE